MGLEVGSYIADLVASNPTGGSDYVSSGDDHLRLIKSVLQNTFPNATRGFYFESVASKTSNYTTLATDQNRLIKMDASGGSRTVSLLSAATAGQGFKLAVEKTDNSANIVYLDGAGAQTIGGSATWALTEQYDTVHIMSDGNNWVVLGSNISRDVLNPTTVNATTVNADDFVGGDASLSNLVATTGTIGSLQATTMICGGATFSGTVTINTLNLASLNSTPIGNATPSSGAFTTFSASVSAALPNTTVTGTLAVSSSFSAGSIGTGSISCSGITCSGTISGAFSGSLSGSSVSVSTVNTGSMTATGNGSVGGTFGVSGATTLGSSLAVTGAATIGSTLGVSGVGTFNTDVNVGGNLAVSGVTFAIGDSAPLRIQSATLGGGPNLTIEDSNEVNIGVVQTQGASYSVGILVDPTAAKADSSFYVDVDGVKQFEIDASFFMTGNYTTQPGNASTAAGAGVWIRNTPTSNATLIVGGEEVAAVFNRSGSSDGTVMQLRRNGTNVGSIDVTGSATSFVTSSDERLKENIEILPSQWDLVKEIAACGFNFINEPGVRRTGFISQWLQPQVPEAVVVPARDEDEDGVKNYWGVDQSKLVPILLRTLQEAQERIEALEAQLG